MIDINKDFIDKYGHFSDGKTFLFLGLLILLFTSIYVYFKEKEQHVGIYILAYGTLITAVIIQIMMWQGMNEFVSRKIMFYGAAIENILMLIAIGGKIYKTEKARYHSYRQLQKVFYRHQLSAMEQGKELEMTMPVGSGKACIISFDIAGSSKIKTTHMKRFFREVFSSCNNLMTEKYKESSDVSHVVSNAFRIKEMGDGMLCSVGFPYKSPTNDPFMDSLKLTEAFINMFQNKVRELNFENNIYCGCGIAYGDVETFFPKSSPVEYDMYGPGIVLACRYEGMRKPVLKALGLKGNILIIAESVFDQLAPSAQEDFHHCDLAKHNLSIRDDPKAQCLYYKIVS